MNLEFYRKVENYPKDNIEIRPWYELKDELVAVKKINNKYEIISTRIKNAKYHFGNPFTHNEELDGDLIHTDTIKEAVMKYLEWILNPNEEVIHFENCIAPDRSTQMRINANAPITLAIARNFLTDDELIVKKWVNEYDNQYIPFYLNNLDPLDRKLDLIIDQLKSHEPPKRYRIDQIEYVPEEDGITHINIYSKGKTELGRRLSNFYKCELIYGSETFASVESWWYWMKMNNINKNSSNPFFVQEHFDIIKKKAGNDAKNYFKNNYPEDASKFNPTEEELEKILRIKLDSDPELQKMLYHNVLPLTHYYVWDGKKMDKTPHQELVRLWEKISEEKYPGIELNISGNDIDTLKPTTQSEIDEYMYSLLNRIFYKSDLVFKIKGIRTGGRTGIEEAAIKAAERLRIDCMILAPKNYHGKERNFKYRFGSQYVEPDRRKWIKNLITNGGLKSSKILYYKELNEPSHADVLNYLINEYNTNG